MQRNKHKLITLYLSQYVSLFFYTTWFSILVIISSFDSIMGVDATRVWSAVYIISLIYIIKNSADNFYRPSVILLLAYLLLLGFGSIMYSFIRGVDYWAYSTNLIGIGYLALWIGTVFPILRLGHKPTPPALSSYSKPKSAIPLYGLAITSLGASLLLFVISGVPLLSTNVNEAKLSIFSGYGYLAIFFRGLPVIALALYYGAFVRNSKQAKRLSHVFAFAVVGIMFLTGYRALTLIFFASYVSLVSFLNHRHPRRSFIMIGIVGALVFLGIMGAYRRGNTSIEGALQELGIILTARPAITDNIILHYSKNNFFYGSRYFNDLIKLLPGSQSGANVDLKYELFANAANMPELAGVTPGICAESYMNFGAWWVPVSLFIVGYAMRVIFHAMKTKPALGISITYFLLLFNMAGAIQSGIGTKLVHLVYLIFWVFVIQVLYMWRLDENNN